jgi:IMP dehydrogenase
MIAPAANFFYTGCGLGTISMNQETEKIFISATFDDFLVRPQKGIVETRKEVDLTMPLSRNIQISLPLVAANMDTVTEGEMMKAMSLEGAFALLHRNCPIEKQVDMVRYVKRQHSFVIENPLKIHADATIAEAQNVTESHKISGLLVETVPESGVLAGILSNRDMSNGAGFPNAKVGEFMTASDKLITGYPDISMEEAERIMRENKIEKLPLVYEDGQIAGLITMKDLQLAQQKPYSSKDKKGKLLAGAAIGATGDYLERAYELIKAGVDCIAIDIAHGHSTVMETAVKNFRAKFGEFELVCGNVATAEGARFLLDLGADGIKVGAGPGRGCRTRLETGFGVPQLQAIREAYFAVGDEVPIIADAGINHDKDIFLAIACGASTIMSGGIFSGTDESPGQIIDDLSTGQKFKFYRGMTSPEAIIAGTYDENEITERLSTPAEGQSKKVPYAGPVENILKRIKGHLQSAVSYSGEKTLADARAKIAREPMKYLVRLTQASRKESFER